MNFLSISDLNRNQLESIFSLADEVYQSEKTDLLSNKLVMLIFPPSSVRTIISFKRGVQLMGGDTILFNTDVLERREELVDVAGYMNNWVDMAIIRHGSFDVIKKLSQYVSFPIVNAMTAKNHPCEIITDLYSLRKLRENYTELKYVFVGPENNVCNSWINAAKLLNLNLTQVCLDKYKSKLISNEDNSIRFSSDLKGSIAQADIILTDSLPESLRNKEYYDKYQITSDLLSTANANVLINPCPPFFRNEEISADLVGSDYFVGYEFKSNLVPVQSAIMEFCLIN
jgi:ornithine carbamoyltransferase